MAAGFSLNRHCAFLYLENILLVLQAAVWCDMENFTGLLYEVHSRVFHPVSLGFVVDSLKHTVQRSGPFFGIRTAVRFVNFFCGLFRIVYELATLLDTPIHLFSRPCRLSNLGYRP